MRLSRNMTSKATIAILKAVFAELGVPQIVMSDNGPAFISAEFKEFADEMNFKHQKITPLHPNANGLVESKMKIINKSIRCAQVLKENWKTTD